MRIVCNKCGRKMNVGELAPYMLVYFAALVGPTLVPILVEAAKQYWLSRTRSFFDDSMAAFANISKTKCPGCNKMPCWNPDPETEENTKDQVKKENEIAEL